MKIYRLPQLVEGSPESQYRLGFEELGTCSVYLLYGRMRPGEKDRRLSPTEGHEEIVCVVKGRLVVKGERYEYPVGEGEAFHLKRGEAVVVENPGPAETIFIAAGGVSREEAGLEDSKDPLSAGP